MSKTYDFHLVGTMTALQPISIVPPNTEIVAIPGGGKASKVASIPVVRENSKVVDLPVITASTIRGKLRRAATSVALADAVAKPGLKAFLYATIGAIKSGEKEDTYSILERNFRRARNPVIALFGAAVPWDKSRALVSHGIPTTDVEAYLQHSTRTDDFVRNNDILEIVDKAGADDYLSLRSDVKVTTGAKADVKALQAARRKAEKAGKSAEVEAFDLQLKEASAALDQASEKSGNSISMPFSHFAIPRGTVFNQEIMLRRVTAAEIGLFLATLDEAFADEPVFGGRGSQGYGQVSAEWAVSVRDRSAGRGKWKELGAISAEPYQDIELPDELQEFFGAWDAYRSSGVMNMLNDGTASGKSTADESEGDKPVTKTKKKAAAVA